MRPYADNIEHRRRWTESVISDSLYTRWGMVGLELPKAITVDLERAGLTLEYVDPPPPTDYITTVSGLRASDV